MALYCQFKVLELKPRKLASVVLISFTRPRGSRLISLVCRTQGFLTASSPLTSISIPRPHRYLCVRNIIHSLLFLPRRPRSMLAVQKRLGAAVLFALLSGLTIISLLWNSGSSTHLHHIQGLGKGFWKWRSHSEKKPLDELRLVVFGDSWADNTFKEGREAKRKSWPDVVCLQV